jgi:hypothetical protein
MGLKSEQFQRKASNFLVSAINFIDEQTVPAGWLTAGAFGRNRSENIILADTFS